MGLALTELVKQEALERAGSNALKGFVETVGLRTVLDLGGYTTAFFSGVARKREGAVIGGLISSLPNLWDLAKIMLDSNTNLSGYDFVYGTVFDIAAVTGLYFAGKYVRNRREGYQPKK